LSVIFLNFSFVGLRASTTFSLAHFSNVQEIWFNVSLGCNIVLNHFPNIFVHLDITNASGDIASNFAVTLANFHNLLTQLAFIQAFFNSLTAIALHQLVIANISDNIPAGSSPIACLNHSLVQYLVFKYHHIILTICACSVSSHHIHNNHSFLNHLYDSDSSQSQNVVNFSNQAIHSQSILSAFHKTHHHKFNNDQKVSIGFLSTYHQPLARLKADGKRFIIASFQTSHQSSHSSYSAHLD